MAENEVCLLEADEALGFFAEVNEGLSAICLLFGKLRE
jgi:hypothetical protein